ncbi:MAG: toprim domain-containing protein [Chloroflexi bacterium]|nr:toprim domain-containing protein [Chloroflexota bacterium]
MTSAIATGQRHLSEHMANLQEIKARHPIADIVTASGVRLHGRGRVLQGQCPFHDEREGSFTVYQDTQRFYCFGCGAKGDVLDYLQRREGLTLGESIERLNGDRPVSVRNHLLPGPKPLVEMPPPDPALLGAAMRFYAGRLWRSRDALAYLVGRGIQPETARRLGLGYAPGYGLWEFLAQLGYFPVRMDRPGLFCGQGERFAGKVVVPEIAGGRVTWLTGRSIDGATPRFQALPGPKPLLGMGRLNRREAVVVTEGVFDWLTLGQWDIPACALLGSHGMERQVHALARFGHVWLAFDNDDAGHDATETLVKLLGQKAIPVDLPDGVKDVADMAVHPHGRAIFLRLLTEATRRSHARPVHKEDDTSSIEGGSDV